MVDIIADPHVATFYRTRVALRVSEHCVGDNEKPPRLCEGQLHQNKDLHLHPNANCRLCTTCCNALKKANNALINVFKMNKMITCSERSIAENTLTIQYIMDKIIRVCVLHHEVSCAASCYPGSLLRL